MRANQGLYRDQGIILRGIRLGEADRILSVLTQSHGRVRCVAKGVRKTKSRFGGRLDAFTHVDLLMYSGRDLDVITQAEIVGRFPRLRTDYSAFTAAAAMADTVERMTPEHERNVRLFVLLRGGLRALDEGAQHPTLLAHAFLAKAASVYGLHPTLELCVGCGEAERVAFSFGGGGAVCRACARPSDPKVTGRVLATWGRCVEADWAVLRSADIPEKLHGELGGLLLGFVQWQIEHRFRAFGLLAR